MEWNRAEKRVREIARQYGSLAGTPGVNTMPALTLVINPLLRRFEDGERTEALYQEMMNLD